MTTITKRLEDRARELTKDAGLERRKNSHPFLALEIALTLEHIDSARQLHGELQRRLLRSECYVESDLLQLNSYRPREYRFLFKIRDNLKNKLLKIEMERRQLTISLEQDLRTLHDRLLDVTRKHSVITRR